MPVRDYGLLVGRCIDFAREPDDPLSPHCHLTLDAGGRRFRAAINVKSAVGSGAGSELVFHHARQFAHPLLERLDGLADGHRLLGSHRANGGLDYIRGELFPLHEVVSLPPNAPGSDNDLSDLIEGLARRAAGEPRSRFFIFGSSFADGIHDIHMNQGNTGSFRKDNGIWQDGGILLHSPSDGWSAVFLAFQNQHIPTDDQDGDSTADARSYRDLLAGAGRRSDDPAGPRRPPSESWDRSR